MQQSFKWSVYNVFHKYPFFKQMPPRLKEKLFNACMQAEVKQMAYFFNDKMYNQKAEEGLVRKIVCALNCSLFDTGAYIIEKGKEVESVYFVFTGYTQIMRTFEIQDKGNENGKREYGFKVRLPAKSWFGDY